MAKSKPGKYLKKCDLCGYYFSTNNNSAPCCSFECLAGLVQVISKAEQMNARVRDKKEKGKDPEK